MDNLGKATYINTMDVSRGYLQVSVKERDHEKTAFVTPFGLYQFKPFGLQGANATFQRMMEKLFDGLNDFVNTYLDDLVVYNSQLFKLREDCASETSGSGSNS